MVESETEELLRDGAQRALRYRAALDARGVAPTAEAVENLERLWVPFPREAEDPRAVLALLDEVGSPATVATTDEDVERSLQAILRVVAAAR